MRRILRSILDLSLFQQLSLIIVTVAVSFVFFFTVYLHSAIDDFVVNQVMVIVERSQETILNNIETGSSSYSELSYEMEISHFIYRDDQLVSQYPANSKHSFELLNALKEIAVEHTADWKESRLDVDTNYYYRICTVDEHTELLSIVDEAYGKSIESTLLNTVSKNSAIVFVIVFLLLIVWVTSIITPLRSIKNYIEKKKNGDDEGATLQLSRNDEIGELANALVEMNDKIKKEEETKEEMIHNISHDLKTPIATIKSYAESIRDGIYPYGTMEASIDVIVDNATRLEKKVYSLLYLNRVDYLLETSKDNGDTANMHKTIMDVLMSLSLIRPEIEFLVDLDEDVYFAGNEENWRIVISNLVDNSLRYAQHKITLTLHPDSFSLANDGPCLSADQAEKMFKPFEKGDKGKFGLGLSICYKVCNAYGYNIVAENLEEGVIFRIDAKAKPAAKNRRHGRAEDKNQNSEE